MQAIKYVGMLCMTISFAACSQVTRGQDNIKIVSPSAAANVEGNSFVNGGPAARVQFLYPAADFMSLPESHRIISGFAWRPDESNALTNPVSGPARFLLSTTTADELSTTFADNTGNDVTTVFEGTVTWQTETSGTGPRDFDFFVQFSQPFTYTQGRNLLLEFVPTADWDNLGNWQIDEVSTDRITAVASGNPQANVASVSVRGLWPAQFTFVPEPTTMMPAILGLLCLAGRRRRKRLCKR